MIKLNGVEERDAVHGEIRPSMDDMAGGTPGAFDNGCSERESHLRIASQAGRNPRKRGIQWRGSCCRGSVDVAVVW